MKKLKIIFKSTTISLKIFIFVIKHYSSHLNKEPKKSSNQMNEKNLDFRYRTMIHFESTTEPFQNFNFTIQLFYCLI